MSMTDLDVTILEELVDLYPVEGIELVRDLVRIFFDEAPDRMSRMRDGLSQQDSTKVYQAAHAMRGGGASLGAVGLARACARIEHQARAGNLTGLATDLAAIAGDLPALEECILSLINRWETAQASA